MPSRPVSLTARALGAALLLSGVPAGTAAAATAGPAAAPTVTTAEVMPHLQALQRIADRNGGNRAHGTRGYTESVAYVKQALDRAGFRTQLHRFSHDGKDGYNLIADWPGGDPHHVLLAGAHLDSVPMGPGINDNGSGSAAVLATALQVARAGLTPERHLRFAWWGAEELGMVGSADYVKNLSAGDRKAIDLYLNLDQAGSKNVQQYLVVKDPKNGGTAAFQAFENWFGARGFATFDIPLDSSDNQPFGAAGIPSSGFSSGVSDCLHDACDNLANVDPATQVTSTNALIGVVWQFAGKTPAATAPATARS
ncbi:M20/M25/M40 family metallo-hydrolase [Streptomyces sp. CBMA123]|uniref:M20/M25/M40 family metallo-hydrolase n=1 Tax=Streptomyces sp. CBMA123 TaxID=1896313 RepID=UPI001661CE8F|nr:M20/M25/M40 family metallo-hydrolase [Streptomyces sp. CBMA123]MBD0690696.1 aminopeptidase [Streptomyces sp. CBMA123]